MTNTCGEPVEPKETGLEKYIRSIPDWPKEGILFRDITPLLADPKAFSAAVDALCAGFTPALASQEAAGAGVDSTRLGGGSPSRSRTGSPQVEYVAAVEARGFIFGAAVAQKLGAGFIPIRKKGKLPYETESVTYDLEYGTDTLEVHKDAVKEGAKVLMVDDLLATGGTMAAACQLIEKIGGQVAGITFLVELKELAGREKLGSYKINTIISY